jgi:hypothetical protein
MTGFVATAPLQPCHGFARGMRSRASGHARHPVDSMTNGSGGVVTGALACS